MAGDGSPARLRHTAGTRRARITSSSPGANTLEAEGSWPPGTKTEVLEWVALNREALMKEWKKWHR
jgi:hypothetical protein